MIVRRSIRDAVREERAAANAAALLAWEFPGARGRRGQEVTPMPGSHRILPVEDRDPLQHGIWLASFRWDYVADPEQSCAK